ncbi:hypothetical protein SuNHUV7_26030 (plasmid) [Pseudoseohaeicola sp. NH-UV-7]
MLQTLGLLLGCQLLGEMTARGLSFPIPGPVLGLAFLVLLLGLVRELTFHLMDLSHRLPAGSLQRIYSDLLS